MSTSCGWSLLCVVEESCPSISRCGQSSFIPAEVLVAGNTRTNWLLCWTGPYLHLRGDSISVPGLPQHGPGLLVLLGLNRKAESWPLSGMGCWELRVFQYKGFTSLDKGDGVEARAFSWDSAFIFVRYAYTHSCSMYLECLNVCHIYSSSAPRCVA